MSRPQVVIASRELFPFGGGGIGTYIAQTARVLAPLADVTMLTASWYRDKYAELSALGDPRVDYDGARVEFVDVPEPHEYGTFYSHMHLYSHRLVERLRALFPDGGPDLIEFPDYLGEGFVATQARRGGDPFFAGTTIAVRLHTSAEMCEVLNGYLDRDFERRISRDLERRTLRDADVLLHAGGDILASYRRFYGDDLAPGVLVRHPLDDDPTTEQATAPATNEDGPLRMIYLGRCERRKGVQDLFAALLAFTADWRLTVLGRDTDTAPLGRSMRRTLELQAAGDHRITFLDDIPRADVRATMAAHDLVVLPSRWECWPYVALEAMQAGVPVLAPRVGGFAELIQPSAAPGWLTPRPGAEALMAALGPFVAEPARVRSARDPHALRNHVAALTDPDAIRRGYASLLKPADTTQKQVVTTPADPVPLVTVVIPYYGLHAFLEEAVASVVAQTYPRVEVIVVNDGSFGPADVALAEVATRYPVRVISQANGGLSAARNFGITQARGRYVLPLDADNVLEPTFIARCVALLEAREDIHFVTSWNRFIDPDGVPYPAPNEGYRPIGNWSAIVHERNVAGDGTAVLRRRLFEQHHYLEDLTAFEDWALYRELHDAGRFGHVIPEMLWRYRIRPTSMLQAVGVPQEERLQAEVDALIREQEVTWVSTNG
ncbi:glycosyltransferase [Paraconexibacter sp. AEG42_29]|uniref:Glycosyltransferase n=1 Tax=Paraconexibacter sp. AEG42_29 TaxID=2997339 RepID=A0AAU7B256_9ACTN